MQKMEQTPKTAGLNLPHIDAEHKLHRVLSSALQSRSIQPHTNNLPLPHSPAPPLSHSPTPPLFPSQYWNAAHFNLDRVKIFQDTSEQEQRDILHLANRGLLEEAYFIEKAGVGYMAKMVLLAETIEERMLYALFSADEATHLAQIRYFLPNPEVVQTEDIFLRLLADVVESQDKTVLLFILQVVLEGWGLSHYRSLAKDCLNPQLAATFEGFLQDESRHHATGVTLFNNRQISPASRATIIEVLSLFLRMVQVGPQRVVAAIEQVKGHLSRQQKLRIFEELDTETHSGIRLNLLRSLMQNPTAASIIQPLEEQGSFQPFPASQCV